MHFLVYKNHALHMLGIKLCQNETLKVNVFCSWRDRQSGGNVALNG